MPTTGHVVTRPTIDDQNVVEQVQHPQLIGGGDVFDQRLTGRIGVPFGWYLGLPLRGGYPGLPLRGGYVGRRFRLALRGWYPGLPLRG